MAYELQVSMQLVDTDGVVPGGPPRILIHSSRLTSLSFGEESEADLYAVTKARLATVVSECETDVADQLSYFEVLAQKEGR